MGGSLRSLFVGHTDNKSQGFSNHEDTKGTKTHENLHAEARRTTSPPPLSKGEGSMNFSQTIELLNS